MDCESSVFGVPPNPAEYEEFPEWMKQGTSLKRKVVMRVMEACLVKLKIEALLRMERTLEEEGLEGFKLIMNGESIIEELAKVPMSRVTLHEDE